MPYHDRDKQREYQRLRLANRRAEFLKGKSCRKCGSIFNLEIHHKDPTTKVSHRIWSWSEQRRHAELAKCEVLCYACHKEITKQQLRKPLVHGTRSGYMKHGCRCQPCVISASIYRQIQRGRVSSMAEQLACTQ